MIIRENASEQIRLEPNIACPQPQLNFDSCVGDKAVIKFLIMGNSSQSSLVTMQQMHPTVYTKHINATHV